MSSAPSSVRFCVECGAAMSTAIVHGAPRRVCDGCGRVHYTDPKVAVGVAVFRDDRLLLARRAMNPGRGLWSLPGGYLDVGEDPRAAAAREALEEAGVVVLVGAVLDVFANPPDDGGTVFVLFSASYVSGEPAPGDDADGAAFFGRDELPPLAFASTETVVRRWSQ